MRSLKPCLLLLASLTAGCGADPVYYLLPPPRDAAQVQAEAASILVAEIGLPRYAEAEEIAVLRESGEVEVNKDALWADSPRRALTRHIIAALQARLDAEIGGEPWPELDRPDLRLEVVVDRMIGGTDGMLRLTGAYTVTALDSGGIVGSDRFAVTVPIPGDTYPALLAAHGRAFDELADLLAPRLARLGASAGS